MGTHIPGVVVTGSQHIPHPAPEPSLAVDLIGLVKVHKARGECMWVRGIDRLPRPGEARHEPHAIAFGLPLAQRGFQLIRVLEDLKIHSGLAEGGTNGRPVHPVRPLGFGSDRLALWWANLPWLGNAEKRLDPGHELGRAGTPKLHSL